MQERENLKKYYTELLQLEFEAEINGLLKPENKPNTDKKIKEFLDKCQFTKYKSPNKPSVKNVVSATDENGQAEKNGYPGSSRIKIAETNALKEISNVHSTKGLKTNINNVANIQANAPAMRNAATVNFIYLNLKT